MSKATHGFPISESDDECDNELNTFNIVWVIIFLFLWVVYLIIQYYRFSRRVFNHLALSFTERISAKKIQLSLS